MGQLRPLGTAGGAAGVEDHGGVGFHRADAVKIGGLAADRLTETVTRQRQAIADNNKITAMFCGFKRASSFFPQR
ncbi:hypothetical protein D3C80_1732290 [compost metagenome]